MESYHNTAIVFGNLKEALLHFEHIIPMNLTGEIMGIRLTGDDQNISINKFKEPSMEAYNEFKDTLGNPKNLLSLYPPSLQKHPSFEGVVNIFNGLLFNYVVRNSLGDEVYRTYIKSLSKVVNAKGPVDPDVMLPTLNGIHQLFTSLVKDFGLSDVPVDCSHFNLKSNAANTAVGALKAQQIQVIDAEAIPLSEILKFREDKDIMKKMRKFRLFAYEQYKGRDKAFIEDDILKRLDDYTEAVKSSGFKTKIKTLSFLFDSKFLTGAFVTSAASLLFGNPQLAIGAFSTGAVIELGKLSLEYAKQKHALSEICRDNPISYLADVKERLPEKRP